MANAAIYRSVDLDEMFLDRFAGHGPNHRHNLLLREVIVLAVDRQPHGFLL